MIERVESKADEVLNQVPAWLWDGRSLPVPVERIVDSHYSLLVREVEDMRTAPGFPHTDPGHLSGLLLTALGEIWVNAEEARRWPQRRRFTIGHELGHWVMHRSGQQSLFCRHANIDPEVPGQLQLEALGEGEDDRDDRAAHPGPAVSADPSWVPLAEREANAFSAAILMPPDLFRAEFHRVKGDLVRLQERFGSSEKATVRRIADLIEA